jgi:hypothetical protein
MGGTPSGDAAVAVLARRFREGGLDTRVFDDPPVSAYWADQWEARLEPGGVPLRSAWPYRYSPSLDPAVTASIAMVDSATGPPIPAVPGPRILYTQGSPPASVTSRAATGAPTVAILTSAPHEAGRYTDWASLGALKPSSSGVPVLALSYNDGQRVEAAARAGHRATVLLRSTTRSGRPKTVVATLPGRTDRYYLVSAHGDSDSGGPGADDNASGVAVLLELASVLASLRQTSSLDALPFTVRFVVWGQEYHSARAFIAREGDALGGCLGVINVDQAGTGAEREAVYVEGNDVPWNQSLLRLFEGVGADFLGREGFWPEFVTTPAQGGTDAYAFLPPAHKGTGWTTRQIPSTTLYTAAWDARTELQQTPGWAGNGSPGRARVIVDYSRYYHSSGDIPEHTTEVEPQNMTRVARMIGIALLRLGRVNP